MLDTGAAGGALVRGSALRLGGYAGIVALSVLGAGVLTRYLGVSRFGRYTVVMSLVGLVSSVTDAGMSMLGTREYSVLRGRERTQLMSDLLGLRVALTLVGVLLTTGFALAAGYDGALVIGTVLAALSVVALVYQHTLSIPLSTSLRLGALSLLDLARQAMSVVLIVALVLAGSGLVWFLAIALAVNVLLIIPTARLAGGAISTRMAIRPRAWAALLRLTVSFSLASAVGTIYVFAAQILTSLVVSGYQNGLFAASFRIFIVISGVPGLLAGAALPVLARAARDDHTRLAYALGRMFHVSLVVGVGAALGALAGAGFMISVVAGRKYAGAVPVLQIQGFALMASFLLAPWGYVLLSLRRHRGLLVANASALAMSATLTLLLAHTDGARGAAIATLCGESTLAIGYLLALMRVGREYRPPLAVVGKVVVAAAPATALALVPGLTSLLRTIAALLVYALAIAAVRALPVELLELLPARMRRVG